MTIHAASDASTSDPAMIPTLTDAELHDHLAVAGEEPVLLYFTTSWCGPCRTFGPELNRYAAQHPDVLEIVRVDGDESPEAVARFRVQAFPTLTLVQGGEQLWLHAGALTEQELVETLPALKVGAQAIQRQEAFGSETTDDEDDAPSSHPVPLSTTVPRVDDPRITVWHGRDKIDPGVAVSLDADDRLRVSFTSDPRRDPACDLSILRDFDDDVVDTIDLSCSDLGVGHIEQLRDARHLASLTLQSGKPLSAGVVAGLGSLSQLRVLFVDAPGTDVTAIRAQLPHTMVNFEWSAPGLTGYLPQRSIQEGGAVVLPAVRLAEPSGTTVIVLADHPAQPASDDVRSALAGVTAVRSGEAADADQPRVQATLALDSTSELLLMHGGEVIARRDTCGPHHVQELVDLASRIDDEFAPATPVANPEVVASGARVVTLDLLDAEALLVPPRASTVDCVALRAQDARVEIPADWALLVRTTSAPDALRSVPSAEVDLLELFLDENASPADLTQLGAWPRLAELTVIMPSWSLDLMTALTHLRGLRRLALAADVPEGVDAEGILRGALTETTVNGEWTHPSLTDAAPTP